MQWAKRRGVYKSFDVCIGDRPLLGRGAEHEVYYRKFEARVLKATHPGAFGATPESKGIQTAATPIVYLHRIWLMNTIFGSDVRLESVTSRPSFIIGKSEACSVITSQLAIEAADENDPHPSSDEIAEFMKELGFSPKRNSYFGWYRLRDNITVLDARTDNFIRSEVGVVPIDLVVAQGAWTKLSIEFD